jgi:hypothetical protein
MRTKVTVSSVIGGGSRLVEVEIEVVLVIKLELQWRTVLETVVKMIDLSLCIK